MDFVRAANWKRNIKIKLYKTKTMKYWSGTNVKCITYEYVDVWMPHIRSRIRLQNSSLFTVFYADGQRGELRLMKIDARSSTPQSSKYNTHAKALNDSTVIFRIAFRYGSRVDRSRNRTRIALLVGQFLMDCVSFTPDCANRIESTHTFDTWHHRTTASAI